MAGINVGSRKEVGIRESAAALRHPPTAGHADEVLLYQFSGYNKGTKRD